MNETTLNTVPAKRAEVNTAFLIPMGSESEEISGISHLAEHILADRLRRITTPTPSKSGGWTSEDFIMLLCSNLSLQRFRDVLKAMVFDERELDFHKKVVSHEIELEKDNKEEEFFHFVWRDTPYEKSPLGKTGEVQSITLGQLEHFHRRILSRPLYAYTPSAGVDSTLPVSTAPPAPGQECSSLSVTCRKDRPYRDRRYNIFYLTGAGAEAVLLERILRLYNPRKHIQFSEKKKKSAFILEKGVTFPAENHIETLKQTVIPAIEKEIEDISAAFMDRAWNELQCIYFHGRQWRDMLAGIMRVSSSQLLRTLRLFQSFII
jgi:hypothetical protein